MLFRMDEENAAAMVDTTDDLHPLVSYDAVVRNVHLVGQCERQMMSTVTGDRELRTSIKGMKSKVLRNSAQALKKLHRADLISKLFAFDAEQQVGSLRLNRENKLVNSFQESFFQITWGFPNGDPQCFLFMRGSVG